MILTYTDFLFYLSKETKNAQCLGIGPKKAGSQIREPAFLVRMSEKG
jgi:hypothetical protein